MTIGGWWEPSPTGECTVSVGRRSQTLVVVQVDGDLDDFVDCEQWSSELSRRLMATCLGEERTDQSTLTCVHVSGARVFAEHRQGGEVSIRSGSGAALRSEGRHLDAVAQFVRERASASFGDWISKLLRTGIDAPVPSSDTHVLRFSRCSARLGDEDIPF